MLLRVYGPILWRSLKCANALVRVQATMIFFDSFPLQDEEATAAEADVILQKQFDLFSSMLKGMQCTNTRVFLFNSHMIDETCGTNNIFFYNYLFVYLSYFYVDTDHRVRAAAASGVCHVLQEFWPALPAATTKQTLSYIVGTRQCFY